MVRHILPKNYERDPSRAYPPSRFDFEEDNYYYEGEPMLDHSETYANYAGISYVGKGPKGYRRSDERLREEVCETLAQHPEVDAREIEVSIEEGSVILNGSVPERHMKYLAEAAIETIWGVEDIINQLKVIRPPAHSVHSGAI